MIHPTSIIEPGASIAEDVEIGAYAIIGSDVVLAEGCKVAAAAQLIGKVEVGSNTSIGHGTIIGADPQDLSFDPTTDSGVRLGENNTLRELVTIHRGSSTGGWTQIGDGNFLMAGGHLAHDVQMGHRNVIANNCLLAGHIRVGDQTFLGGGAVFHQFINIGDQCMVQGNAAISQDIPPYCIAYRLNRLAGLNSIGLKRAGFTPDLRKELKRSYREIFLSGRPMGEALTEVMARANLAPETRHFLHALAKPSSKGVCSPK